MEEFLAEGVRIAETLPPASATFVRRMTRELRRLTRESKG